MFKTPSRLTEDARFKIADALNARLADGLDLHSQIKVAHWNVKGPQFPSLHPLFETFAIGLADSQRRDRRARRHARRPGLRHRRATSRRPRGLPTIRRTPSATSTTSSCSPSASTPTSTASAQSRQRGREAG